MKRLKRQSLRTTFRLFVLFVLAACACACVTLKEGGNAGETAEANRSAATGTTDVAKLDAELSKLEKQSEKNPGDDDLHRQLSLAYMRRADALRQSEQLKEALRDYRNALRHDPDNADAQERAAELGKQVEGEATGENGEPAPLPISPNVTADDEENDADQKQSQSPTPTPKKKA